MRRLKTMALGLPWVALFGLALWFRISSLENLPGPNGDEAFYGIQAERILRGEAFETHTPNHNPLNPFHTGLQVLLLCVFRPAWWILRAPALIAGILAVVLGYVLMKRVLDRPTAAIFALLMATLPPAIVYSRTGYDCSQAPLFGVLVLYFAFRGGWIGVILAATAGFLAHPTNIFLLPVALAVMAVREYRLNYDDPARLWRWVAGVEALAIGVLALGTAILLRPRTQLISQAYKLGVHGDLGNRQFLKSVGRALIGTAHLNRDVSDAFRAAEFGRNYDRAFWIIVPAALIAGGLLLARRRQWDRLATVGGLIAAVAAFRVVAGPGGMQGFNVRYGLFLLAPFALALSCSLRVLLVEADGPIRLAFRRAQYGGVLALGFGLLSSMYFQCFVPLQRGGAESIWTFRDGVKNPLQVAATTIARDAIRRKARRPAVVGSSDWWAWNPIAFRTAVDRNLDCRYFDEEASREGAAADYREALARGAYAVGSAGTNAINGPLSWFPGAEFDRWEIPHDLSVVQVASPIIVLRLKHPPTGPIASAPAGLRR